MVEEPQRKIRTRIPTVLEDPSAAAVARVYATALLDAAECLGAEDVLEELGSFVEDVLDRFPEYRTLLLSPGIGRSKKLRLIDSVVEGRASELLTSFLRTLARHDRLDLLPLILQESRSLYERRQGKKRVLVTSAREIEPETLEQIRRRLTEVFGFEPILEAQVDPSLLGGLVIRFDSTVYDASLRTRLSQLLAELRERSFHEVQSRRDRFCYSEGN